MPQGTIRPYQPVQDEHAVFDLWERTLAPLWPLSREAFQHKTLTRRCYQPGDHLVAEVGEKIVGFVATQLPQIAGVAPRGEIMLIMVHPDYRRQGIGKRLLTQALDLLKQRGAVEVQLGAGGMAYFWPGVPTNLPDAWKFFEACGWTNLESSFDLVMPLNGYQTPAEVYGRIRLPNVTLTTAKPDQIPAILQFEAHYFPKWLPYFQKVADNGDYVDIVLAHNAENQILGTAEVLDGRIEGQQHDFCVWQSLLGENIGGIGVLGVAEEQQGNGIGLALAARVTEILQERGLTTSFIGYTWLVDWYGKLGYRLWREYNMSWRKL